MSLSQLFENIKTFLHNLTHNHGYGQMNFWEIF